MFATFEYTYPLEYATLGTLLQTWNNFNLTIDT